MIGYNPDFDYLYDPQQAKPFGLCSCCGGEIYRPFQETCDRCLMDMELEDELWLQKTAVSDMCLRRL